VHLLVLFDVDGTLIDTAGAGRRAIERAFASALGLPRFDSLRWGVPFAGRTDPVILADLARAAAIPDDRFAALRPALDRDYLEHLADEMRASDPRRRIMPGVRALLAALEALPDVHLGLITGNVERGARIKLEPFGLNRHFAAGGFGSDHADRCTIARLARAAVCRVTGIDFQPARVVVVGDTEHDVACARANGFRAIVTDSGWGDRAAIDALRPDAVFPTLADTALVLRALGLA
jgi:phosphoglycolate phosphatase-like HAD superfamily hydrolase